MLQHSRRILRLVLAIAVFSATAEAQTTVYNNFGPGNGGWDYNWGLGWTVAGENVPSQFGVEQAMGFTATAGGTVSDIWLGMWYVPIDPQYDVVTIRLARNPNGLPPTPQDVMEEWTLTTFEDWKQWNPPHHLRGKGASYLENGESYWLWASGGDTTWCGWCMNENPTLTCPHTLRREGESWLPIGNETASVFRVDVVPGTGLFLDGTEVSVSAGGSVAFGLDAGVFNAGRRYLILGSLSGAFPGTPLPYGGETLPVNWDRFTDTLLLRLNGPIFAEFLGVLDANGQATAQLNAPAGLNPNKVGKVMTYAYCLEGLPIWDFVSNPVFVELVP